MDPGDPEQWDIFNETNTKMFDKNQNKKIVEINEMGLNGKIIVKSSFILLKQKDSPELAFFTDFFS